MARTNNLNNYLTDLATAIKNKKGDQTTINAEDFDTEITNLPTGGDPDFVVKKVIKKQGATQQDISDIATFIGNDTALLDGGNANGGNAMGTYGALQSGTFIDASALDDKLTMIGCSTSASTSYGGGNADTFAGCSLMTRPPLINFSQMYYYGYMFAGCTSLTSFPSNYFSTIPNGRINTGQNSPFLTGNRMFLNCTELTSVDFPSGTSFLYTNSMFEGCGKLTSVSGVNLKGIVSTNSMFKYCFELVDVPYMNTEACIKNANSINVGTWFVGCYKLSDASIDNVIRMLTDLVPYIINRQKKLSSIFTQTNPTMYPNNEFILKIRASQYYSAMISAGMVDDLVLSE